MLHVINLVTPNKNLKNLIEDLNILEQLDLGIGLVVHLDNIIIILQNNKQYSILKKYNILLHSSKKKCYY